MKIGVLALQGDFEEHISVLTKLGADASEVRLPEQLDDLDGLIIPGGESTTIARLLARWQLLSPIRRRALEGMAVGVALHGDVHQPQAFAVEAGRAFGQQDGAGAGAPDGHACQCPTAYR